MTGRPPSGPVTRTMKRIVLAALLLVASTALAVGAEKADARRYTEKGCFAVDVPAGWEKAESALGLAQEEKKVYGADFLGAGGTEGIAPRISVHYYAPGNLLHRTAETFIKKHAQPLFGARDDGETYGPVEKGRLGKRRAKRFERTTFRLIPPHAIDQKRIPVYEAFAVVPAKAGFYVLRLSSPAETSKANLKAYESVLASFTPLLP